MPTIDTLVERVLGELHRIVRTETVVGTPVQAGDITLIPVSKISFGFGAGGGTEGKGGAGTGGGGTVEPIAFVVIDAQGRAQILSLREQEVSWRQLMHLVPDAVARIRAVMKTRGREGGGEAAASEEE